MSRSRQVQANGHRATSTDDAAAQETLVPSRRQYLDLKAQHPSAILLYRLGDFYETFDEDAHILARDARVALTSRSFGRSGRAPMAGIPHHALHHYLGRLLAKGHTVAIAEQMTPPGKGLVERAITRVLSPGTVADPALLPAGENRYLAAVHRLGDRWGLAWVDVSTGEFALAELPGDDAARLAEEVARLNPAEMLVPDDVPDPPEGAAGPGHLTRLESWRWSPDRATELLCAQFRVRTLLSFGCAEMPAAVAAAGAILAYLEQTNPALLALVTGLRVEQPGRWVGLDAATRRNLELTRSLGTGGSRGSLLGVLDLTRTAMGARALRRLIGQPLRDLAEIERRQAIIADLVGAPARRAALADALGAIGDLERLLGRIAGGSASPREFLTMADALRRVPEIGRRLPETLPPNPSDTFTPGRDPLRGYPACDRERGELQPRPATFRGLPFCQDSTGEGSGARARVDECADILALLERSIHEDDAGTPAIRPGFSSELDEAIAAVHDTRIWLAALEGKERERTGIRSLKVGFNKVFGYYLEVTRPNLHLVPSEYTRKQTVANGERFVTAPLKEAEARVLAADEEIAARERQALQRLTALVLEQAGRLSALARAMAELDALLSLAEVAARNAWIAPIVDESDVLEIAGGRHPVVEAHLGGEPFIPNDSFLGGDAPRQLIVTGPNMGGKSTFLRQTAVIVLLAQIGSWVPASRVRVGLVDRIFTRVGAQDDLARGHSTFMAEMVETAAILHQSTSHSLLILDEVGRGTSTDDGLAIAQATLEDISRRIGARALFATHYLELTGITAEMPEIGNVHVAALEREGRVVFLYAVRPGAADRAYGIQVARLAGLPPSVADRAEALLARRPPAALLRAEDRVIASHVAEDAPVWQEDDPTAVPLIPTAADDLAAALRALDLNEFTPRQALTWLWEQQDVLNQAEPGGVPDSDKSASPELADS